MRYFGADARRPAIRSTLSTLIAQSRDQAGVERKVMNRGEAVGQTIVDAEEVMQIGARETPTRQARALGIERPAVAVIPIVLEIEDVVEILARDAAVLPRPGGHHQPPPAGGTGGVGRIEGVIPRAPRRHEVLRFADPQAVNGKAAGNHLGHPQHHVDQLALFADRPAAEAESVETNFQQLFSAAAPQILIVPPLDHREEQRARTFGLALSEPAIEFVLAQPRPGDGALDAREMRFRGIVRMRALIQAEEDVGAEPHLLLNGFLGREQSLVPAATGTVDETLARNAAVAAVLPQQRINLVTAGIGDD